MANPIHRTGVLDRAGGRAGPVNPVAKMPNGVDLPPSRSLTVRPTQNEMPVQIAPALAQQPPAADVRPLPVPAGRLCQPSHRTTARHRHVTG